MASVTKCDMTKGNPTTLILSFCIPMLIGSAFQQFYNMVDSAIVGRYVDSNALAAVGATGSVTFLFFSAVFGLCGGVGIVVSQYYGAKDEERVKQTIATALYVILTISMIIGLVTIICARPIMELLRTDPAVIDDSVLYLRVVGLGVLGLGMYNGMTAILRGIGDSFTPLIFLILSCFLNVGLDLLFVIKFHWGVFGVATATVISQYLAAISCVVCGVIMKPIFRMPFKAYRVKKDILMQTLRVGVPVAGQSILIASSCAVLQAVVNSFGPTIMAAYTVACRFEQLIQQPFNSLGMSVGAYAGQNMGVGDVKRVERGFWACIKISTIFSLVMLPIVYFGAEYIVNIFTVDPEVIREGARGIRINCFFYSALGVIYVTRGVLNGAGDAGFAMYSGIAEIAGRVGFAKPLTYVPAIGMLSIWFTSGFTWILAATVSCIRYATGKWKTKGLVKQPKEVVVVEESIVG